MTNKERQRSLDKKKWFESIEENSDQSGKMYYCDHCPKQNTVFNTCDADQYSREMNCLCATAFNRSERAFQARRK